MAIQIRCLGMDAGALAKAEKTLEQNGPVDRRGYELLGYAADTKQVRALQKQGLIVEVIPATSKIGWLEQDKTPTLPDAFSAAAPEDSPFGKMAKKGTDRYIIQFKGPLRDRDRDQVEALGIKLGAYVPDFAYKAALTDAQETAVKQLGCVCRVEEFDVPRTLRRRKLAAPRKKDALAGPAKEPEKCMFHVRCHDAGDLKELAGLLEKDKRVTKVETGKRRLRFGTTSDVSESLERDIANLPQVSVVEPFRYPKPESSFARELVGIQTKGAELPWQGEGQVIGVTDSGVDTKHPDLKSRVKKLIERVPPEDKDDPFGHGTCVCSIIAGDGTASKKEILGMAPKSQLVVQSVRDADGNYSGLPVDLDDLFQETYDLGVRIHNLSWGFAGAGLWTSDARELDEFMYANPDYLIVVACGNEGQQTEDAKDRLARIGYGSIASPATAKNALTVGASCSSRKDGPYKGQPWKCYKGKLPSPQRNPVASEPISGDPGVIAAFSSRGPTDDERIKPDLVAPGTVILAARSATSTPRYPETKFGGHYAYESGTSMAAPVAAGAAAIVREYLIKVMKHATPSAALLKAALINGASFIKKPPTVTDKNVGEPNFHQGFGRINLRNTLPEPGNAKGFTFRFVDIGNTAPEALDSKRPPKASWKKQIQVKAGMPLRITICWTDSPHHGLQNHIDLMVQPPKGPFFIGNDHLKRADWAKSDRFNNVERIVVDKPTAGTWTIIVNASNTPYPTQGFSLVVTGKGLSDFL